MMEDDKKAESFSDALFTYLWLTENLSQKNAAEIIGESSRLVAEVISESSKLVIEVAKAVTVLTSLTIADFNDGLDRYFSKHGITRRSVFTFIATYCFKYHANNEDIFGVFLKTCAFVYKVVLFCYSKGFLEYIDFASMCWMEVFIYDLKQEFTENGGWEKLEQYVTAKSYLLKHKDSQHKSFLTFFDDINELFPNLKISCETEGLNSNLSNNIPHNSDHNYDSSADVYCQNSEITMTKNLFEIKVSDEEAINAYILITSFYGLNGVKSICEQTNDQLIDSFDMEHVYNTLSYFINLGLLQVESSTGKIIQPNIIHSENIQKATLCCTNCLHEANDNVIESGIDTTNFYQTSMDDESVPDCDEIRH